MGARLLGLSCRERASAPHAPPHSSASRSSMLSSLCAGSRLRARGAQFGKHVHPTEKNPSGTTFTLDANSGSELIFILGAAFSGSERSAPGRCVPPLRARGGRVSSPSAPPRPRWRTPPLPESPAAASGVIGRSVPCHFSPVKNVIGHVATHLPRRTSNGKTWRTGPRAEERPRGRAKTRRQTAARRKPAAGPTTTRAGRGAPACGANAPPSDPRSFEAWEGVSYLPRHPFGPIFLGLAGRRGARSFSCRVSLVKCGLNPSVVGDRRLG